MSDIKDGPAGHRCSSTEPGEIDWLDPATAPKDGTEIRIMLDFPFGAPAYWDAELRTFVLSRTLHMESVARPLGWRSLATERPPNPTAVSHRDTGE